jgi:hypothetical protein
LYQTYQVAITGSISQKSAAKSEQKKASIFLSVRFGQLAVTIKNLSIYRSRTKSTKIKLYP